MAAPLLDVLYTPGFAPDHARLFNLARHELAWDSRMAARQTASCGLAYNYSGNVYPDVPMPTFILELASRIAAAVSHPITNCLANLYLTGESRMGFHSDSAAGIAPMTSTAIVSLGAARTLTLRAKGSHERTASYLLEPGSLFVMAASVQDIWQHALLPEACAEPRISLTFRHIVR